MRLYILPGRRGWTWTRTFIFLESRSTCLTHCAVRCAKKCRCGECMRAGPGGVTSYDLRLPRTTVMVWTKERPWIRQIALSLRCEISGPVMVDGGVSGGNAPCHIPGPAYGREERAPGRSGARWGLTPQRQTAKYQVLTLQCDSTGTVWAQSSLRPRSRSVTGDELASGQGPTGRDRNVRAASGAAHTYI